MSTLIKKPLITEKANGLSSAASPVYTFLVDVAASKEDIVKELERVYGVKIARLNALIVRGKIKSRFTKRRVVTGKKPNYKKVYVTLKEGYTIDIYKNII